MKEVIEKAIDDLLEQDDPKNGIIINVDGTEATYKGEVVATAEEDENILSEIEDWLIKNDFPFEDWPAIYETKEDGSLEPIDVGPPVQ